MLSLLQLPLDPAMHFSSEQDLFHLLDVGTYKRDMVAAMHDAIEPAFQSAVECAEQAA